MLGLEPSAIRCAGSSPVPGNIMHITKYMVDMSRWNRDAIRCAGSSPVPGNIIDITKYMVDMSR